MAQLMTPAPSSVPTETTVLDLVYMFERHRFRHLLVTDGTGHLLGVISDRDVIHSLGPGRALDKQRLMRTTAGDVMSTDLLTVGPNTPLADAVDVMIEHGISCLPVLAGDDLVGILTNTDLHVLLHLLLQSLGQSAQLQPDSETACVP